MGTMINRFLNDAMNYTFRKIDQKEAYRFYLKHDPDNDMDVASDENKRMFKNVVHGGGAIYGGLHKGEVVAIAVVVPIEIENNSGIPDEYKKKIGNNQVYIAQNVYTVINHRRRGVGLRLMRKIIHDKKNDVLLLYVIEGNETAKKFYTSIGFKWAWDIENNSAYIRLP